MKIYAWQMLEGIKTNVLGLQQKLNERSTHRFLQLADIKKYRRDGTLMLESVRKKNKLKIPARKMEKLFICIPGYLRDITGRPTEYLKTQLSKWLRDKVPDHSEYGV